MSRKTEWRGLAALDERESELRLLRNLVSVADQLAEHIKGDPPCSGFCSLCDDYKDARGKLRKWM